MQKKYVQKAEVQVYIINLDFCSIWKKILKCTEKKIKKLGIKRFTVNI